MVTFTVALEDMKHQLADVVRGSIEKGFELVAGVVGAKLAKSMERAVKNAEVVGKGGGYGDMAGLREQIKDNATILLPLMNARSCIPVCGAEADDSNIRIITSGTASDGMRAMLVDDSRIATSKLIMWSHKHATATDALKDLLDCTQKQLKVRLAQLVDPPSPAVTTDFWGKPMYPSFFDTPSPPESNTATASAPRVSGKGSPLLWDASMTSNPSFGGFDYGSFDSGFDSDEATIVDPAMHAKAW